MEEIMHLSKAAIPVDLLEISAQFPLFVNQFSLGRDRLQMLQLCSPTFWCNSVPALVRRWQ